MRKASTLPFLWTGQSCDVMLTPAENFYKTNEVTVLARSRILIFWERHGQIPVNVFKHWSGQWGTSEPHNSGIAHGESVSVFTEVLSLHRKRKKEKKNNFRITPPTTEMILITNSSVGRLFWQMYLQLGKITNELIPYSRVDTDSAC